MLPLKRVTIFNHEAGSVFIMAYGTKMTCIPLNTLCNAILHNYELLLTAVPRITAPRLTLCHDTRGNVLTNGQ